MQPCAARAHQHDDALTWPRHKDAALRGNRHGSPTNIRAPEASGCRSAEDLISRNAAWVTDLTFVPTRDGVAYVCFTVDALSRMIVGRRVDTHTRTEMILDATWMCAGREATTTTICGVTATPAHKADSPRSATENGWLRSVPYRRSGPSAVR